MSSHRISNRHTIAITGASSGIGAAFAHALAARGAALVLIARRRDRLDQLARTLRDEHGTAVTVVPLDLASPAAAIQLRSALEEAGVEITSLINNAGFGSYGEFVHDDPARQQEMIAVNIAAPVQLARAFLPDVIAGGGFLLNVASMAGHAPTTRMAVYGASKAFLLNWTAALWAETRHTGARVFALSPGATSTEFNDVVGTDAATAGARMRTAEDVVATAMAHLERRSPGPSVIDGRGNRLAALATRALSLRTLALMTRRITAAPA